MSLFKLAVVLSVGVAVMPSETEQQQKLYERAAAAAYWTATFCDRNEATCDTASVMWASFVKKAEFAGRLAVDIATSYGDRAQPGETSPRVPVSYEAREPVAKSTKGTLSSEDLAPSWRGTSVSPKRDTQRGA